jgi:hypothetical protein
MVVLTWSQVFGYAGQGCYTIKFLNDTLGYAGAYNSRIFRTTNAGANWLQQTTFQTNEEVTSIDFADLTHGVAVTILMFTELPTEQPGQDLLMANQIYFSCIFTYGKYCFGDSYGGLRTASKLWKLLIPIQIANPVFKF